MECLCYINIRPIVDSMIVYSLYIRVCYCINERKGACLRSNDPTYIIGGGLKEKRTGCPLGSLWNGEATELRHNMLMRSTI